MSCNVAIVCFLVKMMSLANVEFQIDRNLYSDFTEMCAM